MPLISSLACAERERLDEVIARVRVPDLTKLVALNPLGREITLFSREWQSWTIDERMLKDYQLRYKHIDVCKGATKLTTEDGKDLAILIAYTPTTLPLPVSDETYLELIERLEEEIIMQVNCVKSVDGKVNAYYLDDLNFEYRIPTRRMQNIGACWDIAGDSFLSTPSSELLSPRWVVNLNLYEIE